MTTLTELMARDNVTAAWFWTHEVSVRPYTEYEVWDVVFIRNTDEPKLWVTDGATRRTAYFQGIGGAPADSRRATGGKRRKPGNHETLSNLLSDALDADNNPTFAEWCTDDERHGSAHQQLVTYRQLTRTRHTLRTWLGDQYDEYAAADLTA